jgi:hypothetical protein
LEYFLRIDNTDHHHIDSIIDLNNQISFSIEILRKLAQKVIPLDLLDRMLYFARDFSKKKFNIE